MIRDYQIIVLYVLFCLFVPIIKTGSSRYYIAEVFSLLFVSILFLRKKIVFDRVSYAYFKYLIFYSLSWLIAIVLSQNYEHQQFAYYKTIIVTVISSIIFTSYFNKIKVVHLKKIVIVTFSFFLFCHIVVYLQYFYFNKFGMILKQLYDPLIYIGKYWTLEKLLNIRVPSIFKDYFTGSMFFLSSFITALYFYLKFHDKLARSFLILFMLLTLIVEIVISRTSFYGSVFSLLIVPALTTGERKNKISFYLFVIIFLFFLTVFIDNIISKYEYLDWAFELYAKGESESWSGSQYMMDDFLYNFSNNPKILIFPLNNFIDYSNPFYSDNYYFQEIIRSGIYGILAFFIFVFMLIKYFLFKKNFVAVYIVLFFVFLNWKGGNTFFVERSSIITVFCLTLIDRYHNNEKN